MHLCPKEKSGSGHLNKTVAPRVTWKQSSIWLNANSLVPLCSLSLHSSTHSLSLVRTFKSLLHSNRTHHSFFGTPPQVWVSCSCGATCGQVVSPHQGADTEAMTVRMANCHCAQMAVRPQKCQNLCSQCGTESGLADQGPGKNYQFSLLVSQHHCWCLKVAAQ